MAKVNDAMQAFMVRAIEMGVPVVVIADACGLNPITVTKHTNDVAEVRVSASTNKMRADMFKLYASAVHEPKEFGLFLGYVPQMKRALFKYLNLASWYSYLQGVVMTLREYQTFVFDEDIPINYQELIDVLFRGENSDKNYREATTTKKLFERILGIMHEKGCYPTPQTVRKPIEALEPLLKELWGEERKKIGRYVSMGLYVSLRETLSMLPAKEQAAIRITFKLTKDLTVDEQVFQKYKSYAPVKIQSFTRYGMIRLRSLLEIKKIPTWEKSMGNYFIQKKEIANLQEELRKVRQEYELMSLGFKKEEAPQYTAEILDFLTKNTGDLDLSSRTHNCLRAYDIDYGWQICSYKKSDYLKMRNLGKRSLSELENLVRKHGFSFGTVFSTSISEYFFGKTNNRE